MSTPNIKIPADAIELKSIGHTAGDVDAFGKQLLERMGDAIFRYQTIEELTFQAIKYIEPVNARIKLEVKSIESACSKIMQHLFNSTGKRYKLSINGITSSGDREAKSSTAIFQEFVLGLSQAPGHLYSLLLSQVNDDLRSISELIKWYESQSFIQAYLIYDKTPNTHQERTLYDFYKRCISERISILEYQLNGIKQRAIEKARYAPRWFTGTSFFTAWNDRPYNYALPFSEHYFDVSKISQSRHRVAEFGIKEANDLENIYKEDKSLFYNQYFAKISIEQHFNDMNYYLSYLPLHKRKQIFNELSALFKNEHWIGFYALSLPQIEGLFSEMCAVVSSKDFSHKALPEKVKAVRPYHNLSESYFDYYEYYIPMQRNKFAHTGYEDDFKIKSYDMLSDLNHILKTFYELENPLIKAIQLHRKRDFMNFITIADFSSYFQLINDIPPAKRSEIHDEIIDFEKTFLISCCSIEYTCYQMIQDLPIRLQKVSSNIEELLSVPEIIFKLADKTKPEIEEKLKTVNSSIITSLNSFFKIKSDDFEHLSAYNIFLSHYKKRLPSISEDLKELLRNTIDSYGKQLKNIIAIFDAVQKQEDD